MERVFDDGCYVMAFGASGKNVVLGKYENRKRARAIVWEIAQEYTYAGRRVYQMP